MKKSLPTVLVISLISFIIVSSAAIAEARFASITRQSGSDQQQIVKIKVIPPEKPVSPGTLFELKLELTIAPGFHINSNQPGDEMLVPTSVELKKDPAYEIKEIIFPEGKKKKFKFSDKPISVYEGEVTIKIKLELPENICGPSLQLEGKLRYQACDENACLRPATIPFTANIRMSN